MKLAYKIGSGLVSGALMLSSFAPAAFADIVISGNGNSSTNTGSITFTSTTTLTQTNTSNFTNDLDFSGRTGSNEASSNTGGDVTIDTGSVTQTHTITNTGGGNSATVTKQPPDIPGIDISGNGNGSTNSAPVVLTDITPATQTNTCTKNNTIKKRARTGKNKAKNNTNGNVDVLTGDVTQTGTTSNTCNTNTLTIN